LPAPPHGSTVQLASAGKIEKFDRIAHGTRRRNQTREEIDGLGDLPRRV
jgi:hypothetical protein